MHRQDTNWNESKSGFEPLVTCCKCRGSGYIGVFKHILDGICFDCNGKGIVSAHKSRGYCDSSNTGFSRSTSARWYIGATRDKNSFEVLFAFTSDSYQLAKNREDKELSVKCLSQSPNYSLLIGMPNEQKGSLIKRIKSELCV
jgi:hypothetical protein